MELPIIASDNTFFSSLVRHRYCILLAVAFVLMTLMTLWTPPYADDWHYGFIYEKEGPLMQRPIDTLSDVIAGVRGQYLYKDNGRCTPHFFVMLFDGILGHKAFAVCNGLMFALLIHLICLNFAGKRENRFTVASIVLAYLVIFLPAFVTASLWMSGSCNYLWSSVFILFFHYLLSKDISKRWWPLLFVYGIIAGNTHEGIMVGLSVGYAVYYLSHFRLLTAQRWVMLIGLALGVAFLVFSPAALNRATVQGTTGSTSTIFMGGMGFLIQHIPQYFMSLRITYVAVFLIIYRRKFPLLWGTAMIPLAILCMMIQVDTAVSYFGLELCSLIVVLQLLNVERIKEKYATVMAILPVIVLLTALPVCAQNYRRMSRMFYEVKTSPSKDAIVFVEDSSVPYFTDRFALTTIRPFSMSFLIAKYYGKESVVRIPQSVRDLITSGKVGKEFDLHTSESYYICEWDGADTVAGKILYNPSEYAKYPVCNRLGRFTLTEQSIEDGQYMVLPFTDGKRYLIIQKNPILSDRTKGIEVHSKGLVN